MRAVKAKLNFESLITNRSLVSNKLPLSIADVGHISIAVPSIEEAKLFYSKTFGCKSSDPIDIPAQGIRMIYLFFNNIKIELMEPSNPSSPIQKFLDKNPAGGLHHICLTTNDAQTAKSKLLEDDIRILAADKDAKGHHGRDIFFMHPKDAFGTLIEIEQTDN